MESSISILNEAEDISLITLHDARLGLNMQSSSPTTDAQIELMIEWASSEVSRYCNRVFAQEKVEETIFDISVSRLYLSHYPIKEIESVVENGTLLTPDDYNVEARTGKVTLLTHAPWEVPVVVTYTGGYDCPNEVPPDLAKAAMLLTREAYYAALRGDASIRMVGHKESRVIYFDPNAASRAATSQQSGGGSAMKRAVADLLYHYMRINV